MSYTKTKGLKTGWFRRTKITSDETNETIGDITRKNFVPITVPNGSETPAEFLT
jgi:hypothetical protein